MITVPARRVKQFGVEFYQAGLSAKDIDRLVKFEVLGYSGVEANEEAKAKARKSAAARSRVNWDMLEKRISESENAYQRPIIRRKIDELFVTINAKHTRLNPSHIISLAGRKLYPDPNQALAHDIIRSLNEDDTSPLHGEIKMLGTGRGRVSQAPLAEEIVDLLETVEKLGGGARIQELRQHAKRFFLNYIKALSTTFPSAWAGRKYSIKTGAALRAFIRAAPDVMARAKELKREPFDLTGIREAIKPWGERLRDRRFETEGEWKLKLAGGTRGTVEVLTRELRDALR